MILCNALDDDGRYMIQTIYSYHQNLQRILFNQMNQMMYRTKKHTLKMAENMILCNALDGDGR